MSLPLFFIAATTACTAVSEPVLLLPCPRMMTAVFTNTPSGQARVTFLSQESGKVKLILTDRGTAGTVNLLGKAVHSR
jgi:hypothetical protein